MTFRTMGLGQVIQFCRTWRYLRSSIAPGFAEDTHFWKSMSMDSIHFFYIIARFHDFGSYIWAKLQKIKNLSFRKCRQVHVALIENQQNFKSHCYLSMFPRIKRHFCVSIFGHSILRVKPSKNLIKSPWDHLKKHTFFSPWKFLESPEKTMIESMIES